MDAAQNRLCAVDRWVFAWCALTQRARRWQGELDEALKPHGLGAVELLVLWRTGHATSPGITQVQLSRELSVSAAQVCGVVDTLQSRNWLQTVRPREDRRRLHCSLTPLGEAALSQLVADLWPMAQRCLREDAPSWSDASASPLHQEEAA
jgi:DNA-binding MarR family transcriptional regulator